MPPLSRLVRTLAPLALALALGLLVAACTRKAEEFGATNTASPRPTRTVIGGDTLYVGPNERFPTIREAVYAAHDGATVLVHAGTYTEQVEITKPLHVEAFGDGAAVIDGGCERENAIRIPTGSGITVSGLELRNTTGAALKIGDGPDDKPRPSHIFVEWMQISDFNCKEVATQALAGVAVWYADCCVEVRNNVIRYRTTGDLHGKGDGVWFKSNSDRPSNGDHIVADNLISGGWDGVGGEDEDDPHGTFDHDSSVTGNRILDCWDDGIQVEGGNANVIVSDNFVTRCGSGIAFAPTMVGPFYVERNVIRDMRVGLYQNQFCFKIGNAGDGVTYLTNNVCDTEGDGISQTNTDVAPIVSRGNCIRVTRYVWEIADGTRMDFDGDTLWSSSPDAFVEWDGDKYASLREFGHSVGQEPNGTESPDCPIPRPNSTFTKSQLS